MVDRIAPSPIDIAKTIVALSIHDAEQIGAMAAEREGGPVQMNGWKMTAWGPREADGAAGIFVELIDANKGPEPWSRFQFKLIWALDENEPDAGLGIMLIVEQVTMFKGMEFEDYLQLLDILANYLTEAAYAAALAVEKKMKRKQS